MNLKIKETAKQHGVTVGALADRLRVSRQTVNYYFRQGDKNPVSKLEEIAAAIGCRVSDFLPDSPLQRIKCPNCGALIDVSVKQAENGSTE